MKGRVLESGVGPTVTRSLTSVDSRLLSAVALVSFLAWPYEVQSPAQAPTHAVGGDLAESKAATIGGFNSA